MCIGISQQILHQELTDHALIEGACAGNDEAFNILAERYQHVLYRFARSYLGGDQAYDVVQFVLLQLYLSLPRLLAGQTAMYDVLSVSLKPWLFRVTWHRCVDEQRRRKRRPWLFSELEQITGEETSPLTALLDPDPTPEDQAEQNYEGERLRAAIQSLPASFRSVMWLRYTEDLTFNDIGLRLNIPATTARTYFYRARLKLRTVLLRE